MLGKHSGRHAFRERVRELGFELDEPEVNEVFARFKALADRKKELFDGDIEALVLDAEGGSDGPWSLLRLATAAATGEPARADVELAHADGRRLKSRGDRRRPGGRRPQGDRAGDRPAAAPRASSRCAASARARTRRARPW